MDLLLSGELGFVLANLAFVSALVATLGFWQSLKQEQPSGANFAMSAFGIHAACVLGIIGLILSLIVTKQYQYNYVYTHASNQLPLQYVVSCLWEGQEGSFLLWMFWHSLLGLIGWRLIPSDWRVGVIGTLASIELILSSMILGAYLRDWMVNLLYMILLVIPIGYLVYGCFRPNQATTNSPLDVDNVSQSNRKYIGILAGLLGLFLSVNLWRGQTGFFPNDGLQVAFLLETITAIGLVGAGTFFYLKGQLRFELLVATLVLGGLAVVAFLFPIESWKIGSSPFLLLRQARPDLPVFQLNPDFIPANGNGLNPLLQNYWMVIHPPTLFLGFASTTLPLGFVLTALLKRQYTTWIQPATPWAIFSVMILGVGIIMGGYWAYETLNFGGYWNWDPVENASLVPWLTGVGALHALLAFRKGKTSLHLAMLLIAATFILVLYSTFLTRSGVLGESSVHSFTDLGLSGQLLVLLFVYTGGLMVLFIDRWKEIPADKAEVTTWSREFFLFLAALTLTFIAIEISLVTSLPVFNKIFGTRLAPPAKIQLFYYQWNVWFGIAIAALSAIGQYFYWTKIEKETLLKNLFRPFAIAALGAVVVMGLLFYFKWQFVYHDTYTQALEAAQKTNQIFNIVTTYISYGFLFVADELLLFATLFTVFANSFILWRLASRKNLRHIGGSLAHIGFGLMLLGALFSSGYEDTVSINFTPSELGDAFPEEAKKDNVLLVRSVPKIIKDYRVVYKGKTQAQGPISDLRLIEDDAVLPKLGFRDRSGYDFVLEFPARYFAQSGNIPVGQGNKAPEEKYDFPRLKFFIEEQLAILKPSMLNERALYQLEFISLKDSSQRFTLLPEAEKTDNTGMISHPDRKIFLQKDLYVHVSSIPQEEKEKWEIVIPNTDVALGDTLKLPDGKKIVVENVKAAKENELYKGSDLLAKLNLKVLDGNKYYFTNPAFMIDQKNNRLLPIESYIESLGLRFAFLAAKPEENKVTIQVLHNVTKPDYITLKAITKPYINILWLGTFVMTAGFLVAIARRVSDKSNA